MLRVRIAACLGAALLGAGPASATWSIVAVDPRTREVGAAGASCILGAEVIAIVVPDRGAAVAQAMTNPESRPRLRDALAERTPPDEAIGAVTSRWFDSFIGVPLAELRQYGLVSLVAPESPAHFTGGWTAGWSGAETAPGVSVQGNTLRGPGVVAEALAAFRGEGAGCTPRLADRLVAALVAGAEAGGDKRCAAELAALSAFVRVARPDDPADEPHLRLVRNRPGQPPWSLWQEIRNGMRPAPGTRDENPVLLLRDAYRAWAEASGPGRACLPGAKGRRTRPGAAGRGAGD